MDSLWHIGKMVFFSNFSNKKFLFSVKFFYIFFYFFINFIYMCPCIVNRI